MFLGRCSGSLQLNHLEGLRRRVILQWLPLLLLLEWYLWGRDILTFLLLFEHARNLGWGSWLLETALRTSSLLLIELCSASRWVRNVGYNYVTSIVLTLRAYSSSIDRLLLLMRTAVSVDILIGLETMLHLVVVKVVRIIAVYTIAIAAIYIFLAYILMRRVFEMLNVSLLVYLVIEYLLVSILNWHCHTIDPWWLLLLRLLQDLLWLYLLLLLKLRRPLKRSHICRAGRCDLTSPHTYSILLDLA